MLGVSNAPYYTGGQEVEKLLSEEKIPIEHEGIY